MTHEQAVQYDLLLEERQRIQRQIEQVESTCEATAMLLRNLQIQKKNLDRRIESPYQSFEQDAIFVY